MKRRFYLGMLVVLFAGGISPARAGLYLENNFFYFNNSIVSGASEAGSHLYESLFVGATFGKSFFIGWDLNFILRSRQITTATSSMSGLEMGPKFGTFIGKSQSLGLALAVHPLSNMAYTPAGGTSPLGLSGIAFQLEGGFTPQIGKNSFIGFKLLYNYAYFYRSTDASNVTSNVAFTHGTFLPTISIGLRY